jgi:ABC-type Fe3+/spermidine/putrescine transport system ATPase subunit
VNGQHGAALRLEGVNFSYGGTEVVHDLSLEVPAGEMVALLGDSGCGKTTILKLVAGLLSPSSGTIVIDGQSANAVPAERRRAAMVFQKPLLFPYLSVAENVGFSLKVRGTAAAEIRIRVEEALARVRLEGFGSRRPGQLSGGQEHRVALARALVSDPRILLLDEPFAALDQNLRAEIQTLVRGIQRSLRITALFVTHDRAEAAAMTDRIAFLHSGRIAQRGALRDFYEAPATIEAARFFGWQILRGTVEAGTLETALGAFCLPDASGPQGEVWVAFRPEAVSMSRSAQPVATVENSVDLGARVRSVLSFGSGETIEVEHPAPALEPGGRAAPSIAPEAIRLFQRRT